MITTEVFDKAINNPENRNADGSVNWNFVESDFWIDSSEFISEQSKRIIFDALAKKYEDSEAEIDREVCLGHS